jgi:hypothetical protein
MSSHFWLAARKTQNSPCAKSAAETGAVAPDSTGDAALGAKPVMRSPVLRLSKARRLMPADRAQGAGGGCRLS